MIKPNRLQKGDTIGVIAPAGPPKMEKLKQAIPLIESFGLRVQLGKHVDKVHGYLAGTDQQRLEDFHDMIANPTIKAIIFARGGYGTGRIAPFLDYQLVKNNPKIIWGYSDITFLHTAIRQLTGLVTFHGPMLASDLGKEDFDTYSLSLFQQLFDPETLIYSENNSINLNPLQILAPGEAEGQLVGGNLSLLNSTLGTPYEIDVKDKLLLIEDIGEEPYQVDSMLNQLKLSGKIEDANGIIVGDFAETETELTSSLTLEQVFQEYFADLSIPVMSGFNIGHCFPHFAVPLGTKARLSTSRKTLEIEPGVG
ncbi:S66 peptidase family protein [Oceanobacillus halophilus]|uniref:LD-carboxypeptidase n=1 Tax=Oceanobacillus halophilus TaxID=930130 RepID=A0A495A4M9_9BACI|nr:LD-carboxypeptidase [Oceanobacillus halophilus]RKQ34362.1 LD-carboxypeptidase [Oceanobacillus halophilus]